MTYEMPTDKIGDPSPYSNCPRNVLLEPPARQARIFVVQVRTSTSRRVEPSQGRGAG
jgi:hypothetical protein